MVSVDVMLAFLEFSLTSHIKDAAILVTDVPSRDEASELLQLLHRITPPMSMTFLCRTKPSDCAAAERDGSWSVYKYIYTYK